MPNFQEHREKQLSDHLANDAKRIDKAYKDALLIVTIIKRIKAIKEIISKNGVLQAQITMPVENEALQPLAEFYHVDVKNDSYIELPFDGYIDFVIEKK